MKNLSIRSIFALAIIAVALTFDLSAQEPLLLWPNGAPGEKGLVDKEKATESQGTNSIIRVTNVSAPTLTVYPPKTELDTGAAVVVCPGGGYNILAYDLEGTEVIEWLNSIGVTGILLKYRVPRRADLSKHAAPLQDAQRALGMVRHRAERWGIDPNRIGILGFSAGGHLTAMASNHTQHRTYPRVDAADDISCRPDFALLIYPAYLTHPDNILELAPDLTLAASPPPSILIQTQDDGVKVESSIVYYLALKRAKVPVEMHLYPTGGHGYGLRPSEHGVSHWPKRCHEWMIRAGILTK